MSPHNASLDTSDSPSPQPGKKAGKKNVVAVRRSNFIPTFSCLPSRRKSRESDERTEKKTGLVVTITPWILNVTNCLGKNVKQWVNVIQFHFVNSLRCLL